MTEIEGRARSTMAHVYVMSNIKYARWIALRGELGSCLAGLGKKVDGRRLQLMPTPEEAQKLVPRLVALGHRAVAATDGKGAAAIALPLAFALGEKMPFWKKGMEEEWQRRKQVACLGHRGYGLLAVAGGDSVEAGRASANSRNLASCGLDNVSLPNCGSILVRNHTVGVFFNRKDDPQWLKRFCGAGEGFRAVKTDESGVPKTVAAPFNMPLEEWASDTPPLGHNGSAEVRWATFANQVSTLSLDGIVEGNFSSSPDAPFSAAVATAHENNEPVLRQLLGALMRVQRGGAGCGEQLSDGTPFNNSEVAAKFDGFLRALDVSTLMAAAHNAHEKMKKRVKAELRGQVVSAEEFALHLKDARPEALDEPWVLAQAHVEGGPGLGDGGGVGAGDDGPAGGGVPGVGLGGGVSRATQIEFMKSVMLFANRMVVFELLWLVADYKFLLALCNMPFGTKRNLYLNPGHVSFVSAVDAESGALLYLVPPTADLAERQKLYEDLLGTKGSTAGKEAFKHATGQVEPGCLFGLQYSKKKYGWFHNLTTVLKSLVLYNGFTVAFQVGASAKARARIEAGASIKITEYTEHGKPRCGLKGGKLWDLLQWVLVDIHEGGEGLLDPSHAANPTPELVATVERMKVSYLASFSLYELVLTSYAFVPV